MAGSIFIPLITAFNGKGIRDAQTAMGALAGAVKKVRIAAVAAAGAFAIKESIGFVKESVTAARDLERNMVGLGNVFGDLTPSMQQFAKDASAIGLSQVEASKASTFLGSVLKQSGFEMGFVATETKNLVGLASDLAATYGYDVSEALTGMTALFRGEYDPIEKFGVAMKQSEVNALLAARGQKNLTGATLRQAQAQARLDILYQRSTDAQGAYAQQSGSLFTSQKNLAASFENIKASLGASLTGPLGNLLQSLQPVIESMGTKLVPIFELLAKVVTKLSPLVDPLVEVFLTVVDAIMPIVDVLLELIEPLLIPLASEFRAITTIIKPFIPLITFLAKVLGAILAPVIAVVALGLRSIIYGLSSLFELLGMIPGLGDVFNGMNEGLDDFKASIDETFGSTNGLNTEINSMTAALSKKIPTNSIDDVGSAAQTAKKKIADSTSAIDDLLEKAQGIQSSIMGSFDINNVFDKTADGIVESVVYVDGKFKTVVSGVSNTAKDIATGFQANLSKIKTFYANLKALIKGNLDASLIEQITSAGPDAGNATAEAILASGKTGIASLNKTATDIKKVSGDIGATVATYLSESGDKMGNGLIDALMSQKQGFLNAAAALGKSAGEEVAEAVEKSATQLLGEGKISFGEFIRMDRGKQLAAPVPVKKPKDTVSDISSPFYLTPGVKKPEKNTFSFAPGILKNPYNKTKQFYKYASFEEARNKAITYNVNVTVPYGASYVDIGRELVKTIQAFEKSSGSSWRAER